MLTMDQAYDMEDGSNNEIKTDAVVLSPLNKADVESDTSISTKSPGDLVNDNGEILNETLAEEVTDGNSQEDKFVSSTEENGQVAKEESISEDVAIEDKGDKWKLKLDIYSSTSSSGNEDSEADEQKNSPSVPESEKCVDSSGLNEEPDHLNDPCKFDSESGFLGFDGKPDPSAMTAFYQKLIAKSEAAVDIDKWSSCSGSVTPPYSDYNSDDGNQSNLSLHGRERYDTYSERDEDDVSSTPRNNDSIDYGDNPGSCNFQHASRKPDAYVSSSSKGKRQAIDLNNPAFKVPFTLGWKREVVYRSTVDGGANNKRLADIYYYTPTGKKMRSTREVLEFLEETNSSLTLENFTFLKECVHPEDPSLEIIREAKKTLIKDDGTGKRRHRSKSSTPTGSYNPDWTSESPSPRGSVKGKMTPVHHGSYHSKDVYKKRSFLEHGSDSDAYSPPWLNVNSNGSPKYEGDGGIWGGPSKRGPDPLAPCSLRCPGLYGIMPNLQCHMCVCLYHPECVGGIPAHFNASTYICRNCEQDPKENHLGGGGKQTIPPPLVPIDRMGKTSPTHSHSSSGPPRLQRFPQRDAHYDQRNVSNSSSHMTGVNVFARHRPPMFIRGVVGNSGSNRSHFSSNFPDSLTRETSLGQSVATMKGRKYVVVPKNVYSVLPGAANAAAAAAAAFSGGSISRGSIIPISREWLSSLPRTRPSTVKATGGTFIPPSSIQPATSQPLPSLNATSPLRPPRPHGMKPQYVFISSQMQDGMSGKITNTSSASGSSIATPFAYESSDEKTAYKSAGENEVPRKRKLGLLPVDQPASKRAKKSPTNGFTMSSVENGEMMAEDECSDEGSDETPKPQNVVRRDMFSENFMNNLSSGYSALLHVFRYLNVQDLLRAAMVCRLWRDLAGGHHSLWRTVRMKNSQVVDWLGFADTLARNRTEILDLRKMLLPSSGTSNPSAVSDWSGFADTLAHHPTELSNPHKTPMSSSSTCQPSVGGTSSAEEGGNTKNKDKRNQWGQDFCHAISRASASLRRLELCRCGMDVLEGVASSCPLLTALCAQAIRSHELDLKFTGELIHLQELRLKSPSGMNLIGDLTPLERLTSLKHLSITTVRDLSGDDGEKLSILGSLTNLESLELGECSAFGETACKAIENLQRLSRLRLERGEVGQRSGGTYSPGSEENAPAEEQTPTNDLLTTLSKLPNLVQLELVNFDIGPGFDEGLEKCTTLHRLLIIPNYVAQSAASNKFIMSGAMKLSGNLNTFTWGVTHEVLQALELFVASDGGANDKKDCSSSEEDHNDETMKRSSKGKNLPSSECLPILKPVPSVAGEGKEFPKEEGQEVEEEEGDKLSRVEFVPLSKLHGLLSAAMPNTKVQIVKMPFSATWRQGISEVDL